MVPVGYMYKSVSQRPDWLEADKVKDIYSVSGCVSSEFADWINYWKHNGYWFFNNAQAIEKVAYENNLSLNGMKLFFYFAYEFEWHELQGVWLKVVPELSFETNVILPIKTDLEGFDVVSFSCGNSSECSPLSCNSLAKEVVVNSHCLLDTFDTAKALIENGFFNDSEPGPFRIFEVHSVNDA